MTPTRTKRTTHPLAVIAYLVAMSLWPVAVIHYRLWWPAALVGLCVIVLAFIACTDKVRPS